MSTFCDIIYRAQGQNNCKSSSQGPKLQGYHYRSPQPLAVAPDTAFRNTDQLYRNRARRRRFMRTRLRSCVSASEPALLYPTSCQRRGRCLKALLARAYLSSTLLATITPTAAKKSSAARQAVANVGAAGWSGPFTLRINARLSAAARTRSNGQKPWWK